MTVQEPVALAAIARYLQAEDPAFVGLFDELLVARPSVPRRALWMLVRSFGSVSMLWALTPMVCLTTNSSDPREVR